MDRRHTLASTLRTALGVLALAGLLALSWPGVRVAKAGGATAGPADFERFMAFVGEQPAAAPAPSETCDAGKGLRAAQANAGQMMAEMKRRALQAQGVQPGNGGDDGDGEPPRVMMLNSRGYNYGAAPDAAAQLGQLHQEIVRRRVPNS